MRRSDEGSLPISNRHRPVQHNDEYPGGPHLALEHIFCMIVEALLLRPGIRRHNLEISRQNHASRAKTYLALLEVKRSFMRRIGDSKKMIAEETPVVSVMMSAKIAVMVSTFRCKWRANTL